MTMLLIRSRRVPHAATSGPVTTRLEAFRSVSRRLTARAGVWLALGLGALANSPVLAAQSASVSPFGLWVTGGVGLGIPYEIGVYVFWAIGFRTAPA